ncbi:succinyl-diaminopimelate desuccinylase [Enemella sp. A6]|uniref:succinyl-diaminopimelate desuccinylase n=1 Tax=Enemella sp. A6 TaxID=3440152 RepID=UPI003EBB0831
MSTALDLRADVVDLLVQVIDVESVSGNEGHLADLVQAALDEYPHLEVIRDGDAVIARTNLGRAERVVIAGHLDTVPVADNLPARVTGTGDERVIHGRGSVDMKGGVAVALSLAAELTEPSRDITWVFYDNEEVEAAKNGLGRLVRTHPELLAGDFAVLGEPTAARVEGGCQGTLRGELVFHGSAAHSARSWTGHNAIHDAAEALRILSEYDNVDVEVDGLVYREGLSAVHISGGIAGNVIPDRCELWVNYRFAPDKTLDEAIDRLREFFPDTEVTIIDAAAAARPGLDQPLAADFLAAVGGEPKPKYGWTDVARFADLGIPAVNYGPGDPTLAHTDHEHCPAEQVYACRDGLRRWLAPRHG